MKVKGESEVAQSCPTLSNPMNYSRPGFSVRGIFQARVLEWGAIAFSDILGSITGALYSLSVLLSCIAVKDTSQLLLRSNISVSSHCLSAVLREMLKVCPKHFHVWGSKLKGGCIIFMAAEKNQELWKLTRLLKAFTLMMHMLHLLMFHWPTHII